MSKYLGSAGIFSTDDPLMDQLQIETEQGPWDEWDEEFYGEEKYPEEKTLYGCCPVCIWWDWTLYDVDDPNDLGWAKEELCRRHQAEQPDCNGQIDFG